MKTRLTGGGVRGCRGTVKDEAKVEKSKQIKHKAKYKKGQIECDEGERQSFFQSQNKAFFSYRTQQFLLKRTRSPELFPTVTYMNMYGPSTSTKGPIINLLNPAYTEEHFC